VDDDLTIEMIDRFLEKRGWRKVGDFCWEDSTGVMRGLILWPAALEVQFERDRRTAAAETTRALAGAAR
jgi:hypothetical protein